MYTIVCTRFVRINISSSKTKRSNHLFFLIPLCCLCTVISPSLPPWTQLRSGVTQQARLPPLPTLFQA